MCQFIEPVTFAHCIYMLSLHYIKRNYHINWILDTLKYLENLQNNLQHIIYNIIIYIVHIIINTANIWSIEEIRI